MTPACPVTGSQRPLQHCAFSVQSVAAAWHAPPPGPTPPAPVAPPGPPLPAVPPRPAPPSAPSPGPAAPPPHDAIRTTASRPIEEW